eukprot:NODE_5897_length_952_cov_64.177322_g5265_i1.p1 GENE.NODE_5897_length_952_cov_64.177322_g5265_i1~~NODE_5897_length_952_cov_64.177322_g5265_i1.p1  ORF type:complete len:288 (-),score=33.79 NODE_5897_length_952_cov_64.177322_g5265_i1:25-888(-)
MVQIKFALCQLDSHPDKSVNVDNAVRHISTASARGADVVVLPECFNSPYGTHYFPSYAEPVPEGETCQSIRHAAESNGVVVVAGSIPERGDDGKLYNTCVVFSATGEVLAKYRKIHLFSIDTAGLKFSEADTLTAGNEIVTFTINSVKIGLGICFDIRYPEITALYQSLGTQILIFPGAFNMVTGPVHWTHSARARAVDGQQFIVMCSPARNNRASYIAYGHSLVVDPWGTVLGELGENQEILMCEIDTEKVDEVRKKLPIHFCKRDDLYEIYLDRPNRFCGCFLDL